MHARKREYADQLRDHLQEQESPDYSEPGPQRGQRNVEPCLDEIEWRKDRERDAAHSVYERFVAQKNAGHDKTDEICR